MPVPWACLRVCPGPGPPALATPPNISPVNGRGLCLGNLENAERPPHTGRPPGSLPGASSRGPLTGVRVHGTPSCSGTLSFTSVSHWPFPGSPRIPPEMP